VCELDYATCCRLRTIGGAQNASATGVAVWINWGRAVVLSRRLAEGAWRLAGRPRANAMSITSRRRWWPVRVRDRWAHLLALRVFWTKSDHPDLL